MPSNSYKSSFIVYIHIFPDNKKYVGQTTTPARVRWSGGRGYKTNKVLQQAINDTGWDNIDHRVFEVNNKYEMDLLERYFIEYYNTTDPEYGYNIGYGGNNNSKSDIWKSHIGSSLKGRIFTEDHLKHMSECRLGSTPWNKGIPHDQSTRDKISAFHKGRTPWNKGVPRSEETRRKIAEKHIGVSSYQLDQFTIDGTFVKRFDSIKQAGLAIGLRSLSSFYMAINSSGIYYGYKWVKVIKQ